MFYFIANDLSLDFSNTLAAENGVEKELIPEFRDFVEWTKAAGIIDSEKAERLLARWENTREADEAMANTLKLRTTITQMTASLAAGSAVAPTVVEAINTFLRKKTGHYEIKIVEDGYKKITVADFSKPIQLLTPIAESAANLLCYGRLEYVRKCENELCVLYFYDTSKNHRRRWCSMAACGNRAKASAFYKRRSGRT